MTARFVHLHVHSEYSLVDSTIRISSLVSACAKADLPALALTDQANLFALVKFYKECEKAGVKPIAGADVWVANPADRNKPTRLTLLCQNRTGYLNLSRLVSRAYVEGQHGDFAQIDPAWFSGQTEGLIALLGRESDLAHLILAGKPEAAAERCGFWLAHFNDRLYLEISRVGHASEAAFNEGALHVAALVDCPVVATNDVRFLEKQDFNAHEARVCIHQGRVLADPKRPRDYTPEQYLKSPDEMAALFADIPEALQNSVEIAKRCNLELSFGTYYLPAFPVPPEHTLDTFIREQARQGLAARLAKHGPAAGRTTEEYAERLEVEVDVIVKMGFPGYFLIVADFINWAKQNGIPVGPGRGSGAGSLVAYCLGITDLDPLPYDLLFERFLNPERVSMPDFDVDFCMDRRDEVIDYVARAYGRDHVSQIITYGTMAAKAAVRDCGRVLGHPYGFVDGIAKLIPMTLGITLDDALGRSDKSRKDSSLSSSELIQRYQEEEEVKALLDLACELEDLTRNAGKHAGGVVIAPSQLTDFAPLYCEAGGTGVVTQFDKDDVESVGLVKFDFLGLRTLTIIDWAVKAINARRARSGLEPVDITAIPIDDADSYKLLKSCATTAVFQLESRGMKELIKKLQPDTFEDIIALVALFRPGPLQSGMVDDFINRKHGRAEVTYPHPKLEPVLKPTYGVIVYQEQVMQIAQVLAGYTLGGADLLRRAMGKKKPEEMAKERVKFEAGSAENGVDAQLATSIFDLMEKFAEYGFNKSHSAAYALVSYQTAWLKAHFPAEFMAAVLSSDMDNTDKVVNFLDETRAMNLRVLPPDVNASAYMFEALDNGAIRYGLGAIKGVGQGACENIVAERERGGNYRDLLDFCQRVDLQKLNKRVLEALINAGALDALAPNRASLMAQLPEVVKAAEQHLRDRIAGQNDMFGASSPAAPVLDLPVVDEWPLEQRLSGERETLGHYLSGHPTDSWKSQLLQLATCPLGEIEQKYQPPKFKKKDDDENNRFRRGPDTPWTVAGQVVGLRKRGDTMAFVQLEDWSGRIEVSFFREAFVEFSPLLTRDAILVVEGGLSFDDFSNAHQVRARSVLTLEQACERFARHVRLQLNGVGPAFADTLRNTLLSYRGGQTPVRLGYANRYAKAELELGSEWRVRAGPDLTRALTKLDGVVNVDLQLARAVVPGNSSKE
ncbi:DNA polymerase III subunit alpha [Tahibacter amnicola]|uniref:DNA polymerase III subunit alpha n=1 Tax=Tahibacter amnicola TaxID=2976241 RepID=A0ABY6BAC2_9GAMM|nr:DNA polymerase III subunit alpha [Tahibacter amnicola]UXI66809.1 DNA polymerase III subunit alpha [Tahibacter amnicola]